MPRGMLLDAGVGWSVVSTYGAVTREIPMPRVESGLMGLAELYHSVLRVDLSLTAVDGTGTSLKGGAIPVPNMTGSGLEEGEPSIQPRPGNMPGLYIYGQYDSEAEKWTYYHYGGPLNSGASPQTTAIYTEITSSQFQGLTTPPTLYANNLSGAQLWYYGGATTPYIEVKHVDGTVARFEAFKAWSSLPALGGSQQLWHLVEVRDAYDNTAVYSYDGDYRLQQIAFPNGLKQKWNWSPVWNPNGQGQPDPLWSGFDLLEITYEQGATALPARTWGMAFLGTMGGGTGFHFARRLYRTYSAQRDVLVDPTQGTPHTISVSSVVLGQIVHEFTYDTGTMPSTTEEQHVHTGATFAASLASASGLGAQALQEIDYVAASGADQGRVAAIQWLATSETVTCDYNVTVTRTTELLLSHGTMKAIKAKDPDGTERTFEYDYDQGHIYRRIIKPDDDTQTSAVGRPRHDDFSGVNATIGALASNYEPERIEVDHVYDGTCVCQKPIEVRITPYIDGSGEISRSVFFEYYDGTHLLKKRSEPSPDTSAAPGSLVNWTYRYLQAVGSGQNWGAWLIEEETTPDGTYVYTYANWQDRQDAAMHGQMPGTVMRTISVRLQTTLTSAPTSSAYVVETEHRNLSNSPGGLTALGPVMGLPRRIIDGDGVETTFEYSPNEGWMTAAELFGGASRTEYTHNSYAEITEVRENVGSSVPATITYVPMSGVGVAKSASTTSGGLLRATEAYFDRYGHAGVVRWNNLNSVGDKPNKHGASGATARDWIEQQYHYQHYRLLETYRDRLPLDEAAGAGQFLVTELDYVDGRLSTVVNPNGSTTHLFFDGYGTLYRWLTKDPTDTVTVLGPKRFINPFLEVVASYEYAGLGADGMTHNHLWTEVVRNDAGAVVQVVEPSVAGAPPGYAAPTGGGVFSTGGASHEFDLDAVGRVIATRTYEGTALLAQRELRYDQLDRQISQKDEAWLRSTNTAASSHVSGDDHYVAWKYRSGKATQLDAIERTGVAATTYQYLTSSGLLQQVTDGASPSNTINYDYHSSTVFVRAVMRTDAIAGGGYRVTETQYDVDPFGRRLMVRLVGVSGNLLHKYYYDSLGMADSYVDPAGVGQVFLRDAIGRVVEHVRLGDGTHVIQNTSAYLDSGQADGRTKITRTDGMGYQTVTHFDFAGRPFIVQNPGGSTAPTASSPNQAMCLFAEYDEASRLKFLYDGEGGKTQYYRDGSGRVIARGLVSLYDPSNTAKMAMWNTTDYFRRDAVGRVAQNDYWGVGFMGTQGTPPPSPGTLWAAQRSSQDSLGRVHDQEYRFAFAPLNTISVTSGVSDGKLYRDTLQYDDGMAAQVLNLQFDHDSVGRLAQIEWDRAPGGGSTEHVLAEYGWAGSLRKTRTVRYQAATHPQGVSNFSFDDFGRLNQIKDDVSSGSGTFSTKSQFDYEYDEASNLTHEWYDKIQGGKGDRFAYDDHHRLMDAWLGASTTVMSDPNDPSGFVAGHMDYYGTYAHDEANNRTTTTGDSGSGAVTTTYTSDQNRYEQITVGSTGAVTQEYDQRGNLTYDGRFAYRYDYMNRLQEVWRVAPSAGAPLQEGEKMAVLLEESMEVVRGQVRDDVPDLMRRLFREHMDPVFRAKLKKNLAGGALRVSPTPQGGGGRPGFLLEPASMELYCVYIYDGFNRRTMSVVVGESETQFHTYDGWRQVGQYEMDSFSAKPVKQFVWGSQLDELVSYRRNNAGTWENYYVLHGGQDTAAKLLDHDGNLVEQYEYDPYGRVTAYTPDGSGGWNKHVDSQFGLPFLWKGIRLDSETGLLQMRNRYYSTETGRFLTNDPLGAWADIMNSGNGYGYCGEGPVSSGDPMGLQGNRNPHGDPSAPQQLQAIWVKMGADGKGELSGEERAELHDLSNQYVNGLMQRIREGRDEAERDEEQRKRRAKARRDMKRAEEEMNAKIRTARMEGVATMVMAAPLAVVAAPVVAAECVIVAEVAGRACVTVVSTAAPAARAVHAASIANQAEITAFVMGWVAGPGDPAGSRHELAGQVLRLLGP